MGPHAETTEFTPTLEVMYKQALTKLRDFDISPQEKALMAQIFRETFTLSLLAKLSSYLSKLASSICLKLFTQSDLLPNPASKWVEITTNMRISKQIILATRSRYDTGSEILALPEGEWRGVLILRDWHPRKSIESPSLC